MNAINLYHNAILDMCRDRPPVTTAVVHPVQSNVLQATAEAAGAGLITPLLVGPKVRKEAAAEVAKLDISGWELVDAEHSHEAAGKAVEMAASGRADAVMKGSLHSDKLLSAIIHPVSGLRTERRISHAYLIGIASYPKPFIITDAAVNIFPDLAAKADIVQNSIRLWQMIFGHTAPPKVAILAAVETINAKMTATPDAAAVCKMADRGQITGGLLDGPLAFDNAISAAAAADKGIISAVAGDADILLVPDIEAGNMPAKQLTFLGGAEAAGIVLGTRVPIILTKCAYSLSTRLLSCALAVLLAAARTEGRIR